MAIKFDTDDEAYLEWLHDNPKGFVLNIRRNMSITYMGLHRPTCFHISTYDQRHPFGAFTERDYIKICSSKIPDIEKWINRTLNKNAKITMECQHCCPRDDKEYFSKLKSRNSVEVDLQNKINKSTGGTRKDRLKRLSKAPKKPKLTAVLTYSYNRNPDVIVEVLNRAKGCCERCKKKAPFNRSSDKTPYLEVHHKKPLSKGGDDTVKNAFALCPNCHRGQHFGLNQPWSI